MDLISLGIQRHKECILKTLFCQRIFESLQVKVSFCHSQSFLSQAVGIHIVRCIRIKAKIEKFQIELVKTCQRYQAGYIAAGLKMTKKTPIMQSSSMERRMKGTEGTVKRPSYCYYSEVKNLQNLGKMPFSIRLLTLTCKNQQRYVWFGFALNMHYCVTNLTQCLGKSTSTSRS